MQSTMRLAQFTALGALVVSAFGLQPAAAQYYPGPRIYAPAPPPPPEAYGLHNVDSAVRSLGLRPVSHVRIRGPVLVVDAVGQEGSLVRVSIDRYSGRVMRIVRVGHGAPQIVAVPAAPGPYEAEDDDDYGEYEPAPPHGGPSVITRQGIEAGDLPPRSPDVTGSVPRHALNGVPREFRGGQPQRLAARPPDPAPRVAPLPKPRPADAPAVARTETEAPKPAPAKQPTLTPEAKADAEKFPPAQGFE